MISHRSLARFRPSRPLDALILTSLIWFLGKFLRYAFPPLFESLGATYDVSNAILGTAFTGFMLAYAAMQFPSGVLADRFGSVPVVTGGALFAAAAAVALIVDAVFAVVVAAMIVMGAGTGAHKTVAVRLLSRIYPETKGRAIGIFDTIGAFGGVAAPAAVVFFIGMPWILGAGWRLVFLVGGIAGVVLALLFVRRVPSRLPDDPPASNGAAADASVAESTTEVDPRRYLTLFRRPTFTTFVVVVVLFAFAYSGVMAFLPLYLVDQANLASSTASLLYSALFAASLSQVVTGEVSDRIGQLPVMCATLGLAAISLVAVITLSANGTLAVLGIAVVLFGLGAHGAVPVRGAYLMTILPDDIAGGSLGVVRTFLMGSSALAPAVAGFLSEAVGFRFTFWLFAVIMATATILVVAIFVFE